MTLQEVVEGDGEKQRTLVGHHSALKTIGPQQATTNFKLENWPGRWNFIKLYTTPMRLCLNRHLVSCSVHSPLVFKDN